MYVWGSVSLEEFGGEPAVLLRERERGKKKDSSRKSGRRQWTKLFV